jgi:hypothetical protein
MTCYNLLIKLAVSNPWNRAFWCGGNVGGTWFEIWQSHCLSWRRLCGIPLGILLENTEVILANKPWTLPSKSLHSRLYSNLIRCVWTFTFLNPKMHQPNGCFSMFNSVLVQSLIKANELGDVLVLCIWEVSCSNLFPDSTSFVVCIPSRKVIIKVK